MKFKNKKVLIFGMGDSGRAAASLLEKKEARVGFFDDDVRYRGSVGFVKEPLSRKWDLVVVSPGVDVKNNQILQSLMLRGKVVSEIDLASMFCSGKIVAITGTNGKTTTCMLVQKMAKEAGFDSILCGNVGLPFSSVCEKATKNTLVVCEISSFQLETSRLFRADLCAILNVQPDHLERHGSFAEYVAVKGSLLSHLKRGGRAVLNLDDETCMQFGGKRKSVYFSKFPLKKGVYVKNGAIFSGKRALMAVRDIPLLGEKNLENVLAAVAISEQLKIPKDAVVRAIKNFSPAAHRMQIVGTLNGVTYVDDSKATNVASTLCALEAFKGKSVVLLLGGLGKGGEYDQIFECEPKRVIAFGSERDKIRQCGQKFGVDVTVFEKFEKAVKFAKNTCSSGDVCLLSPACSSFDEFSGYGERGDFFSSIVLEQS